MTTYTTIANSQIDLDSPITEPLMTALRDNPIAIAEGATGAPKIADSIRYASGDAFGAATISTLDVGSGVRIDITYFVNQNVASNPVYFQISDNGSTWTNQNDIAFGTGDYHGWAVLYIDFANNSWRSIYNNNVGGVTSVGSTGGSLTSAEGTAYVRVWTAAANGSEIHILGVVTGGFAPS